ncbi:MAG: hypothetical protein HY077_01465 [Elusimicrobia bacterium]|nr:hypothetical protein [Elusimicrobiota bacterium]
MKTRPERHNLLIAAAALMIAASLAAYCLLFLRWLGVRPATGPFSPKAPAAAPVDLAAARAQFRDRFLDPDARMRLAEALYARGRWVDAFYVLRDARQFFGETAFRGAHARVVLRSQACASEAADDPCVLARSAFERGEGADALKYAEAGLAARPNETSLLLLKAELTAQSDLMGAIPVYARLANASPSAADGRKALEALSKLAQRKETEPNAEAGRLAREALAELFKAQPKNADIFASLAMSEWNRGDAATARAMVAETLRKEPAQAGALMVDGVIALAAGDTEKALKAFSAAWEHNPNDLTSAAQLARIYDRQRGDRESALPYYIALYRDDPDYAAGEPAERLIQEILDARRKALLERVGVESLGRYLSSEDASLRAEACARAASAPDPRWIEALADLLDDDTDIVRHNADYALYQIAWKQPGALRVRKDQWLQSPRPLLRTRALNLFADLYSFDTFPAVAQALHDPSPTVRFLTKTMVLDRYYKDLPAARKVGDEYLASEKDPAVLALYAAMGAR